MFSTRRNFSPAFKLAIVLELFKGERDLNSIAAEHQLAPNLLRNWKKEFIASTLIR